MTDQDPTRPSPHEARVADEEDAQQPRDPLGGEVGLDAEERGGMPDAPTSDAELEAERRGTTADEIEEGTAEDERTPLDSAYQPRTG